MKRLLLIALSAALLLSSVGCSRAGEEMPPEETDPPVTENAPDAPEAAPAPAALRVADLVDILDALDLSEATLTYHSDIKTEDSYPADAAIRAEDYIEKLKAFAWVIYEPSAEQEPEADRFYQLSTSGAAITAFPGGHDSSRLLHLITNDGEGWFILPDIKSEQEQLVTQPSWMMTELFFQWYTEARSASLYSGSGTPLSAEELTWFEEYTTSTYTEYDPEFGGYHSGSTPISCFFTSQYDDVRELNFKEFLRYFPGDGDGTPHPVSDAEFEALKGVDGWPFEWVEKRDDMPVPIHKYPRSTVDAVLTKYAGITTADLLDTSGVAYLEEYDAFYNYTSDFGPGMFTPRYGEKNGSIVTLWRIPAYDGSTGMLKLEKVGEAWHILSHQSVES